MAITRQSAIDLDNADPLRNFRERFFVPLQPNGEETIYFTGNSLGLQPRSTESYIKQELEDWKNLGVEGHFHAQNPWMPYHEFLTEQMATIVGAKPIETVVMNSLTVNLHLLLVSFYRPTNTRYKIMIEKDAFPSDHYAVRSQIDLWSSILESQNDDTPPEDFLIALEPRKGEASLRTEDIVASINENKDTLALVMLGGVNYYTGQFFDLETITRVGHDAGATVGFDLAHAAGNVRLKIHERDLDIECWSSYKNKNSGPGGIAGANVHQRHSTNSDLNRFAGWWGLDKETRFLMGPEFQPIAGAEGWQLSNPPIFQMASLRASLDIFEEAGMDRLFAKSKELTNFLERLLKEIDTDRISIITPSEQAQRGCQLSIRVNQADKSLFDAITKKGVIADWREPDVIRVAPVPLYNSFEDCWKFTEIVRQLME